MPLANLYYKGTKIVNERPVDACKKKTISRQNKDLLKKRKCHIVDENGRCERFMSLNPIKEPPKKGSTWEVNPELGHKRDPKTKKRTAEVAGSGWIKNLQEFNRANMKESGVWVIPRKYKEGSTEENPLYVAVKEGKWQGKFDVRVNGISQQPPPQPQKIVTVGGTVTNKGIVGGKQYVDTSRPTIHPEMSDKQIRDWWTKYKKDNTQKNLPNQSSIYTKRWHYKQFKEAEAAARKKKSTPKTPIQQIPKKQK